MCVLDCPTYPQYYYAYDPDRICRTDCPSTWMRDPYTRKCVSTCPNNTFFDNTTDQCVQKCPTENSTGIPYYGDTTYTIPKCVIDADCSNGTYADDQVGLCVSNCSYNQWKYGKKCLAYCPNGYYGNYATGFCVQPSACPTGQYA